MEDIERKKISLIHEKEFESYGIKPEEVFKNSHRLKSIPKEWIYDMIEKNIYICNITMEEKISKIIDMENKSFTITFNNDNDCLKFYNDFMANMIKCINLVIINNNEDPLSYNRMLVFETNTSGKVFTIRY